MVKIAKPTEGDVIALDLDDGRYAVGILARVESFRPRKPYGIFVYFFGPYSSLASLELTQVYFSKHKAITRLHTSALGMYSGEWRHIGKIKDWDRNSWEFPDFYETEFFTGRSYRLRLDEKDLISHLTRIQILSVEGLDKNLLYGSEAARKKVSEITAGLQSIDT
jgi:Immunity protein 26